MTETVKQCRVCGDPITAHRLPLKDCVKKAYDLPMDWPGDYSAYLVLCLKKDYLTSYGGSAGKGPTTVWFRHINEKLVTMTPADDMARIILTDLVEQKPKKVEVKETPEDEPFQEEEEYHPKTEEE